MMIKLIWLIFGILSFSAFVHAEDLQGLKREVLTRHMGYIHSPESRNKFTTFGSYHKYRTTQRDKIRTRLNSSLESIRKTLKDIKEKSLVTLKEYDPTLPFKMVRFDQYDALEKQDYPSNVRVFMPKSDSFRDKEYLCFSLYAKPDKTQFKLMVDKIKGFIEEAKPQVTENERKYKSAKEQELFEALKEKTIEYYWYEPYFGIYLGGDFLIDTEYSADARKKIKTKFDAVYESFKTRYFTTSENSLRSLVKNDIVIDIQNIIEKQGYPTHLTPFTLDRSKLPQNILRIDKKINEIQLIIVFGVNGSSMNKKNEAIIMDFVDKSQGNIL
ncbi:MAG: hypothetical protein CME65_00790 [Halobacteriovoraceae bacterium]|nr:hypothetical protein [Halobacteriovoraceae bacterium]